MLENTAESFLGRAAAGLARGSRVRLGGLRAAAPAWALAGLAGERQLPHLIACPTPEAAARLYEDLRDFLGEPQGASLEERRLFHLPAWEQRPYDNRSPSVEHSAARSEVLFALATRPAEVCVVISAAALAQRTAPLELLKERFEYLIVGAETPFEELAEKLVHLGYRRGPKAEDRGEFAVKGGIVDVFAPGYAHPLRLEFVGETLETAKFYDPLTQRTLRDAVAPEEIHLLPMAEIFFDDSFVGRALEKLSAEQQADEADFRFITALKQDIEARRAVSGVEYLLSYFYEGAGGLLDHLPAEAALAVLEPAQLARELEIVTERLESGYARRAEERLPASKPELLFVDSDALRASLDLRARLVLEEREAEEEGWETVLLQTVRAAGVFDALRAAGAGDGKESSPFAPVAKQLAAWQGEGRRVVVACHTLSQLERAAELLRSYELSLKRDDDLAGALARLAGPAAVPRTDAEPIHLIRSRLSEGFEAPHARLVCLTEEELVGARHRRAVQTAPKLENALSSLSDLNPGDFVVQADHGVGKFLGLEHLVLDHQAADFLLIEYADGDKLYVPATRIGSVAKYGGPEGHVPALSKMGGARWQSTRKRVREAVLKLAGELLELYAAREAHEGFAFPPPDAHFRAFEAKFEFDETPDQARAIREVLADMQNPRPMDRLVCGDVGFGKTEVALRAAFFAVLAKKQVGLLVPTTVLAEQHLLTFRRRLGPEGVRVEALSRLHAPAEQKRILEQTREGKVDVLIGTHRLLQKDIVFKDLGLVIVDEEQRFGVKHKEQLKKLRRTVDVLSLSATPIPRTLHMALAGIRDLSIITTPPQDRLSIRTIVCRRSDRTTREAVTAEVDRGGQVFYLHNRVRTIEEEAAHLRQMLPDVRFEVAHGQMDPNRLEMVMTAFLRGEFQVLVCTSIIESGLDIPNANTLIVDRADEFGLAQLYQIRGRVGRSSRRAYAYLLLPESGRITDDAEKRLAVLQEHSDLGAGFRIATYDLELRGGGNLLGESQSGHVAAVGLELYTELLEEAVHELRGEPYHERYDPEINLGLEAFLPEAYVPDVGERISLYKKLSAAPHEAALADVADEVVDRYGVPPPEARNLFAVLQLAHRLRGLNIVSVDLKGSELGVAFHKDLSRGIAVDLDKVLTLVTARPQRYRLRPDQRLLVHLMPEEASDAVAVVHRVLDELG